MVWKTLEQQVVWHQSVDGRFEIAPPDADGVYRSTVFPGLWLDSVAMLAGRMNQVLSVLNDGLATMQDAAFVSTLQARRQST